MLEQVRWVGSLQTQGQVMGLGELMNEGIGSESAESASVRGQN